MEREVDFFGAGLAVTPVVLSLAQDLWEVRIAALAFGVGSAIALCGIKRCWRSITRSQAATKASLTHATARTFNNAGACTNLKFSRQSAGLGRWWFRRLLVKLVRRSTPHRNGTYLIGASRPIDRRLSRRR